MTNIFREKYQLFNTDIEKFNLLKNMSLGSIIEVVGFELLSSIQYGNKESTEYFRLIGKTRFTDKKYIYDGCKGIGTNFPNSHIHEILNSENDEKKYVYYLQCLFDVNIFNPKTKDKLFAAFQRDIQDSQYPISLVRTSERIQFEFEVLNKYEPYRIAIKPSQKLSNEFYQHVLKNVFHYYASIEMLPKIHQGKDEESLRDLIIPFLNQNYTDTVTSGETFNKNGKTDIIIKDTNGTNLFIAECKVWKGVSEFHKGVNQLIERYTNWRDSKIAILIFNTANMNFSGLLETIHKTILTNPYISEVVSTSNELTKISCLAKINDQDAKQIKCEIQVFNFVN